MAGRPAARLNAGAISFSYTPIPIPYFPLP